MAPAKSLSVPNREQSGKYMEIKQLDHVRPFKGQWTKENQIDQEPARGEGAAAPGQVSDQHPWHRSKTRMAKSLTPEPKDEQPLHQSRQGSKDQGHKNWTHLKNEDMSKHSCASCLTKPVLKHCRWARKTRQLKWSPICNTLFKICRKRFRSSRPLRALQHLVVFKKRTP